MPETVRPDLWELLSRSAGAYVLCSCGHTLTTQEAIGECWRRGHFDLPVTPEVIRAAVAAEREACAKVAEEFVSESYWETITDARQDIAAAIRARTDV